MNCGEVVTIAAFILAIVAGLSAPFVTWMIYKSNQKTQVFDNTSSKQERQKTSDQEFYDTITSIIKKYFVEIRILMLDQNPSRNVHKIDEYYTLIHTELIFMEDKTLKELASQLQTSTTNQEKLTTVYNAIKHLNNLRNNSGTI